MGGVRRTKKVKMEVTCSHLVVKRKADLRVGQAARYHKFVATISQAFP